MWGAIAPVLARRRRVIVPDLLGYGMSDPRPTEWSVEDWAADVVELLKALDVAEADVLGGHAGAAVAVEAALLEPVRVRQVVVDGVPLMTPELRAAFAGLSAQARPGAEGAETLAWSRTVGLLREYIPGFSVTDANIDTVWNTMRDYLATDFVSSGPVMAAYDIAARLPLLRQPVLVMGAERDTLAGNYMPALALTGGPGHWFAGDHPVHDAGRAEEYAAALEAFL
jgi:pimeloyl-ACP methyl ester carboxylesterase